MEIEERVRRYVAEAVGLALDDICSVTRFDAGERHAVFRVTSVEAAGRTTDLVVRLSTPDHDAGAEEAAREAAVLRKLHGAGAPRLLNVDVASPWFDAPVMCMQHVDGHHRDLTSAAPEDLERLGAVVATVHRQTVDDVAEHFPGPRTTDGYLSHWIELIDAYLPRLRDPLPAEVRDRVPRARATVRTLLDRAREVAADGEDDGLVLLHGDIAPENVLWNDGPVLIDWEYVRFGDPADEIAYVVGQNGLDEPRRAAFWAGYRRATPSSVDLDRVEERARWWEPVNLLGSALWWLERWSRRVAADDAGAFDPSVRGPAATYLDGALLRLDRFDRAIG